VATTTLPNVVAKVAGSVELAVADPEAFAADPVAQRSVQSSIASLAGVEPEQVSVTLTPVRRLAATSAALRRLQGGSQSVRVDYTIIIASAIGRGLVAGAGGSIVDVEAAAAEVGARLAEASPAEVGASIAQAIAVESPPGAAPFYQVVVKSISAPTVETLLASPAPMPLSGGVAKAEAGSTGLSPAGLSVAALSGGAAMLCILGCAALFLCSRYRKKRPAPGLPNTEETYDKATAEPTGDAPKSVVPTVLLSNMVSLQLPRTPRFNESSCDVDMLHADMEMLKTDFDRERGWAVSLVAPECTEWTAVGDMLAVQDPRQLGWGRDVREKMQGRYQKLVPVCVWRIEAPFRHSKFLLEREETRHKMKLIPRQKRLTAAPYTCTKLDTASVSLGVDTSVFERFLLHGATPHTVMSILQNGMNERYSAGHFGKGSYLTEDAAKMDQYVTADRKEERRYNPLHECLYTSQGMKHPGQVYYAFACRTILGFPVFTKDGQLSSDSAAGASTCPGGRPVFATEDERELATIPEVQPPIPFQSMIVECGPVAQGFVLQRHREFVITHAAQILPELLVAYRRE